MHDGFLSRNFETVLYLKIGGFENLKILSVQFFIFQITLLYPVSE